MGASRTVAVAGFLAALALGAAVFGCGSGGDEALNNPNPPVTQDGGSGSGGTAGTGGSGGTGGATGGTGGATGGSGGTAGSGGTSGTGGSNPCGDCEDGIACTVDWCDGDSCRHAIGPNSGTTQCPPGTYCDAVQGCVAGVVCATTDQCLQQLGSDPCKTNIACDPALAVCVFDLLDKDGDTQPPVVCGGADCNDDNANTAPGMPELCDGDDNDCDGQLDEGATCPGLSTCSAGTCACPPDNACGADCVDKQTSNQHCGSCNNSCPSGANCQAGSCVCTSSGTACPSGCVDLMIDPNNCGSCGAQCASGYACAGGHCTCDGTSCGGVCVDTSTNLAHCGTCNHACGANQSCVGGACVCAGNKPPCAGVCVDTNMDPSNCGACGVTCTGGKTCSGGTCVCPSPLTDCGGCVDTSTSTTHCGTCNHPCSAGGSCVNGTCASCPVADFVFLLDASGSMSTALASGQTRWEAIQLATKGFIAANAASTHAAALSFLPIQDPAPTCTTVADCPAGDPFMQCVAGICVSILFPPALSCDVADYTVPSVAFGLLSQPSQRSALDAAIDGKAPDGSTPMSVALQGALTYGRTRAQATGHRVAVVFLTDGVPNACPDTATMTEAATVAQQFANGTPSIKTYVIAVGSTTETDWTPTQWNQLAVAGGTAAFYPATSQAQISTSLTAIRDSVAACL